MGLFSKIFPPAPPPPQAARPRPVAPAPEPPRASGLAAFFTQDHADCDKAWAEVESAEDPAAAFASFDAAMRRHLRWEEEVLFPAFEDATGHHGFGPTWIMRGEHEQMRAVLDQMGRAAALGDRQGLLDHGDTLLMLIQQHNAKEEGMLYPMSEEVLGAGWEALRARLA